MLNARSTEPIRRPASLMPPASCPASRQSSTRTYVTSPAANAAGTASPGSLPTRATRAPGRRAAASTNRSVASKKYGATKTTLGTGRGQYPSASLA